MIHPHAPGMLCAAGILAFSGFLGAQQTQATQNPLRDFQVREVRPNTFTSNRQVDASIDVAPDGRILAAWGSRRQENGTFGVFAQLFDPLGRPLGTEMHVNEWMPGSQVKPAVAFAPDGSAWIVWNSYGQDGSGGAILMRHLGPTLEGGFAPLGHEFPVNPKAAGDQAEPSLAIASDGRILVTWTTDGVGQRIVRGRFYSAEGEPLDSGFTVDATPGMDDALPCVSALDRGRFALAWARHDAQGPHGIRARLYGADGAPLGAAFAVDRDPTLQAVEPSLDADASGRFVIAWMATDGENGYQVHAQRFTPDGRFDGAALAVPRDEDGPSSGATVAMAPDGRFLLAWNVHEQKLEDLIIHRPEQFVSVRGRIYSAQGENLGGEWRINRYDDGEQTMGVGLNSRHALWSPLGQVAVAWHGRIDGDAHAIGLTIYAPQDLTPPAPPQVTPMAALIGVTGADLRKQRETPPEWMAGWVDDSFLPNPPPQGPDFGFTAHTATGWIPPDPDLAVGLNHIVSVVNVEMRVHDKSGNLLFQTGLESFFGTNGFVFDPIALYDEREDRYVIATAEQNGSTDYFDFAVTATNDPTGSWHKYRFNINSLCDFVDFPNLGVGSDAYYVAADCFGNSHLNYIHVIEKAPVLAGSAYTPKSVFNESGTVSTGATRNYDNDATGYFVSTYARGTPYLRLYAITNASGTPQRSSFDLNVGAFSSPPDAEQLGSSSLVATIDHRIKNGVVRNGIMYLVHNVDGGDGAAKVRWYKIDLRGWPASGNNPTLLDHGDIDEGFNVDTWYGDVNVDAQGDMAIAFNRSSPNEYVGVYRTYRIPTDPAGSVRAGVQMQVSTSPDTSGRWGDYSGLEEDPAAPGSFWNHHEYRTSSWRTWIGHFQPDNVIVLTMSPLVRGTTATMNVTGGADGEVVFFGYSLAGTGAGPCFSTLGGLCLDILDPVQLMGTAVSSGGVAVLNATVPPNAPLIPVWTQAAIARGVGGVDSIKSNVATETIQ